MSKLALAPRVQGPMSAGGRDWVGVLIRLKGTDILAVYLYLTDSLGPVGVNACKLREVSAYLMADGRPFVIMAGWNMEPAQLRASGFLGLLSPDGALGWHQRASQRAQGGDYLQRQQIFRGRRRC